MKKIHPVIYDSFVAFYFSSLNFTARSLLFVSGSKLYTLRYLREINERKYWRCATGHLSDNSVIISRRPRLAREHESGDNFCPALRGTRVFPARPITRLRERDFYIRLLNVINRRRALYARMRFYATAVTSERASALARSCQGHGRDMQSSHASSIARRYSAQASARARARVYTPRRIYRTLMHNALRDDGKYGYITRQRPMLFSPAPRPG